MSTSNNIIEETYKPYVQSFLETVRGLLEVSNGDKSALGDLKKYWIALEIAIRDQYPQSIKDAILYAGVREWLSSHIPDDIVVFDESGVPKGINYEAVSRYVRIKYCPVYFKRIFYIYKDGFFVEGYRALRKEIQHIISDFLDESERKSIRAKIDEVIERIANEQSVEDGTFPFNWGKGDFIPFLNGVYWLEKDILLPHSPYWMFTYKIPWNFDRDAKCPNIDNFFREIVAEEDIPLLYEFPALALMQEPGYARAYMLVGNGGNGKSTYLSLITMLLGEDNVSKVSLQDLNMRRFAPVELVGKLANVFPDLPHNSLRSTSIFKAVTGSDSIYVEKKFKDPFSFKFRGRLAFSTNQLPAVDDESYAFWRRWALIEFPNKYSENPELLQQLVPEIPGLINKVIDQIRQIKEQGLAKTKKAEEIMERWRSMADSVYYFVRKRIVQESGSMELKDEVYQEYSAFCEEHDLKAVAKNIFGSRLQQYVKVKTTRRRVSGELKYFWQGIRLIREDEVTDDGTAQSFLEV